ncbi:MAG: allantoinase AllB [Actinobacteria bacterium]|nr:allantoinase AllB [Actinomycetota bacterium]
MADLVVRGGVAVLPDGAAATDVAVEDGRIAAIGSELPGAAEEIDARGLHVFPGGVDPHVHFDEPGRTHWEGVDTGSRSLAAGGLTTFVDMPLNNDPVTVDRATLDLKLEAIRHRSHVDFALWGGLVPGNVDRLEEQLDGGVLGFKAFMCHSGIDEFPGVDDITLYDGMQEIAALDSVLLLHAENAQLVAELGRRARERGTLEPRDFAAARPPVTELEAIARAIAMAEATGCRTHIVHVSLARGVELVTEAAARGVDVSCENCPHFLLYTEDDLERIGLPLKSAPPVRSAADREGLWALIDAGNLEMVTSDHSPGSPDVKQAGFWDSWGGISGCQSTLQLLLAEGHERRGLALPAVARLCGGSAAERFRLEGKGAIAVGNDADLALVDLTWSGAVSADDLLYRHPTSAYEGLPIRGRVVRTLLRGRTVLADGTFADPPAGLFLPAGRRAS